MAFTEFTVRALGSNLNAGTTSGSGEEGTSALFSAVGDSDGTSVFTPSDGSTPASTVSVGMFGSVYVTAGATVATFVGRITAVAAGVNGAITFSTTAKSGTFPAASAGAHTISLRVGGAWLGPNGAVGFPFNFAAAAMTNASSNAPRVNLKTDQTYSVTAAMTHTPTGPVTFQGYTSAFADGGRAAVDGGTSGASYVPLTVSGANTRLTDLEFRNNGATGTANLVSVSATRSRAERCVFRSCRGSGIAWSGAQGHLIECEAYGCNASNTSGDAAFEFSSGNAACLLERCVAHDNAGSNGVGFVANEITLVGCVADSNGSHGLTFGNVWMRLVGCVFYGNGGDGARVSGGSMGTSATNCVFYGNGGYGFDDSSLSVGFDIRLANNAYGANTSGPTRAGSFADESGAVTLTGDPFTDAANGDFRLNSTAGAGAACRGAGRGTFTQTASSYAGTVGYPDIGAAQHQDTTGGGAPFPVYKALLYETDYQDSPY